MGDDDDLVIRAEQVVILRGLVVRALDRASAEEDRAAARAGLVGAFDYLLREHDRRASPAETPHAT